jgi:hypothetical protein
MIPKEMTYDDVLIADIWLLTVHLLCFCYSFMFVDFVGIPVLRLQLHLCDLVSARYLPPEV